MQDFLGNVIRPGDTIIVCFEGGSQARSHLRKGTIVEFTTGNLPIRVQWSDHWTTNIQYQPARIFKVT